MRPGRYPGSRKAEYQRRRAQPGAVEYDRAASKAYRLANPERTSELKKAWARENRERKRALDYAWRAAHPEKVREYNRRHVQKNLDKWAAYGAKRRAKKLRATPPWLTADQFQEMADWYALAQAVDREVDHIVPLAGKNVSGLHVPWNLQLLTTVENRSKGNRHA